MPYYEIHLKYIYNCCFLSFLTSITETIRKDGSLYVSNCVYAYLSFGEWSFGKRLMGQSFSG